MEKGHRKKPVKGASLGLLKLQCHPTQSVRSSLYRNIQLWSENYRHLKKCFFPCRKLFVVLFQYFQIWGETEREREIQSMLALSV